MTEAVNKPGSAALSRLLASKFDRSRKVKTQVKGMPMITPGYQVRDPGYSDHIVVDWILGERFRSTSEARKLELRLAKLREIQNFLEDWNYPVENSGKFGLKVFMKKMPLE